MTKQSQYSTERYSSAVQYGPDTARGCAPLTARAADVRLMHGVGSAHHSPAVLHAPVFQPLHAPVVHASICWDKLRAFVHCAGPLGLLHASGPLHGGVLQPTTVQTVPTIPTMPAVPSVPTIPTVPSVPSAGWQLPAYPAADLHAGGVVRALHAPGWRLPANPDIPGSPRISARRMGPRRASAPTLGILTERNTGSAVDLFQLAAMGGPTAFNKQTHI